jgi:ATP/maltotriose-dependent transcriptional regulator MalT
MLEAGSWDDNDQMSALVGRETVLASVERLLGADPSEGSVLAIEGLAGMGKTAVWLAGVAEAEGRGYRVLQARPAESEAQLAYSGITDLLGPVFDAVSESLPAPQAGALAAALLRSEPDQPVELRAVATGVNTALAMLAATGPVLVAIDDVQWLDRASQRVLDFVARRLPAAVRLLIMSRQDADSTVNPLLDALPEDLAVRAELRPLSVAALHHLLQDRVGLSLTRPVLTRLAEATGGNPLFALEVGRALVGRPAGWTSNDPLPVPSTLQHLVAGRVERLSASAREALLVAAALSGPTAALLARVLTLPVAEAALSELRDADMLVADRDRLRFSHPLLASAVYGSASPDARRDLHRRLAALVADPEDRARHLAAGTTAPDARISAELEQAAGRAAFRGAQDTAADLYDGAWRLTPEDHPEDRARRLLGQATSLNAVGDFAAAGSTAGRALELARSAEVRTSGFLLLASIAWFDGEAGRATRLAEEALIAAGQDRSLQGVIHAQLARFHFSLDLGAALSHADLALEVLSEERQPDLMAQVLIDRVFGGALRGEVAPDELLAPALELEARSLGHGMPPQPMPLLWFHCVDDLEAARARFVMEERWYRERGEDVWVADRLSHLAVAELHAGSTQLAERYADESCSAVGRLTVGGPRAMVFEKRALVDAHLGRVERARTTLQPLLEEYERMGQDWWAALSLSTLAFVEYAAGDPGAADAALVRMRDRADRVGATDVMFDRSEPFHIEVLLELGDLDGARAALARLEERGKHLPRRWIAAALPRSRAMIAAEEGDLELALSVLEEADTERTAKLPFELGWTLAVQGRLQRRSKQKRGAADSFERAVDVFEGLGAPGFADRARSELARVGLRRAPTDLTPTELTIATLAAGGMTNREVAQAAFISQKTVEANLARVYRKLGIRSRAELGSRMAPVDRAAREQT